MTLTNSSTASASAPVHRETTVLDIKSPTPTEVDWSSQFAAFPVRINYSQETHAFTSEAEGTEYRFAGEIVVRPELQEILVNVYLGATKQDFDILTILDVRYIREGYWNSIPWQQMTSPTTGEVFYKVKLGNPPSVYEQTGHDWLISPCYETGCLENGSHHLIYCETDNAIHHGDTFEHDEYAVKLVRYGSDPWELSIDCDGLPASAAGSFLSDIAWLTSEARKLNAALEMEA